MSKWNGKRFSVYESEEKSVLGLIKELGGQTNYNTDELEKVKESNNKKVSHDEMHNTYKIDENANFTGSWWGIKKPTASQEGLQATVDKINEEDIPNINSQLDSITNKKLLFATPEQFGAIGNGLDNDTTAIKNAIQYCKDNGYYLLMNKKYLINEQILCSVSILGSGSIFVDLKGMFILDNNVTLNGITLDGKSTGDNPTNASGQIGLVVRGKNIIVDNVKVNNTHGGGIRVEYSDNVIIKNCNIYNVVGKYGDGICVADSKNVEIFNNKIDKVNRICIVSDVTQLTTKNDNIKAYNNICTNAYNQDKDFDGTELNGGIWFENTLNATIKNNFIKDCNTHGITYTPLNNTNLYTLCDIDSNTINNCLNSIVLGDTTNYSTVNITNNIINGAYKQGLILQPNLNILIDNIVFNKSELTDITTIILSGETNKNINGNITIRNIYNYNDSTNTLHCLRLWGNHIQCKLLLDTVNGFWTITHEFPIIGELILKNMNLVVSSTYISRQTTHFLSCEITINQNTVLNGKVYFDKCKIMGNNNTLTTAYCEQLDISNSTIESLIIANANDSSLIYNVIIKNCVFNGLCKIEGDKNWIGHWNIEIYETNVNCNNIFLLASTVQPSKTILRNVFHVFTTLTDITTNNKINVIQLT